ncbi:LysM peptidoglycan-binding domain-containing protein [uncultured Aquimarina sp.]|uniref:LysM peptidoglycan-binding domain-containing protein n=1 Tax=uncultured Aquimarina sp. TaxID=575652 RepID=UPI0026056C4E|nr:LysM peptidoglycan-binding domain-containing protein [uncultured Aquimarina sp.]
MPTLKFKDFPNIFKTITPLSIVRPKVTKAYFAEATIEEIEVESESGEQDNEIYTVESGDTLSKIANKKGTTVAAIIESDETITTANQNSLNIGQEITLPSTVAAKEKQKKITFKKVDTGNLGQELYVIVETELLQGKNMAINIRQGKEKGIEEVDQPVMLKNDQGKFHETIKTTIGGMCETDYLNKDDFADQAIFKVAIDHKDEKKKEAWIKAIENATDQKTLLYILTDAHTLDGQTELNIQYLGDTEEGEIRGEKVTNRWLDTDGQWFEFKKGCDCGKSLNLKFKCVKYTGSSTTQYGPLYGGTIKTDTYSGWNNLISQSKVNNVEKDIIIAVTKNEGKLDSVHSYDSEIFSAGSSQKTVNSSGKGEFPKQVAKFKKDFPKKYKELFEDCGWILNNDSLSYKDPLNSSSTKLTGSVLKTKIREGFDSSTYKSKLKCTILEPIVKAMKDADFQSLQIVDVKKRLSKVSKFKPSGYSYKISDYFISKLGKAVALDHHINRPAYVKSDLGKALDNFFVVKDSEIDEYNKDKDEKDHKEKISRNPNDWGSDHSDYETIILEDYGVNRRMSKRDGVSVAPGRYEHLKTEL